MVFNNLNRAGNRSLLFLTLGELNLLGPDTNSNLRADIFLVNFPAKFKSLLPFLSSYENILRGLDPSLDKVHLRFTHKTRHKLICRVIPNVIYSSELLDLS